MTNPCDFGPQANVIEGCNIEKIKVQCGQVCMHVRACHPHFLYFCHFLMHLAQLPSPARMCRKMPEKRSKNVAKREFHESIQFDP